METSGFKIIPFIELRRMRISQMTPRPRVVFVNRRTAFKPPETTLRKYEDYLRRFKGERGTDEEKNGKALRGSHYDNIYRRRIMRDKKSIKQLREICQLSRKQLILMVKDRDRPDADILVSICTQMIGAGVW